MVKISGNTRLLGIIGQNLAHSLSPKIHNFSADLLKLDFIYVPLEVANTAHIQNVLSGLWEAGFYGLNVTAPLKQLVANAVRNSGSINTLKRTASEIDQWQSTSTDGRGFLNAINHLKINLLNTKRMVVLGGGGVLASLVEAIDQLERKNTFEIAVLTRKEISIKQFDKFSGVTVSRHDFAHSVFKDLISHFSTDDLIVHATTAPQQGKILSEFAAVIPRNFQGAVIDLNYGPNRSALFHQAQKLSLPVQDGIPMLIEQARLSQEYWWGKSCSYSEIFDFLNLQ